MSRNSQNRFLRSFAAAGSGIWQAIRQERNLRFHLAHLIFLCMYDRIISILDLDRLIPYK